MELKANFWPPTNTSLILHTDISQKTFIQRIKFKSARSWKAMLSSVTACSDFCSEFSLNSLKHSLPTGNSDKGKQHSRRWIFNECMYHLVCVKLALRVIVYRRFPHQIKFLTGEKWKLDGIHSQTYDRVARLTACHYHSYS